MFGCSRAVTVINELTQPVIIRRCVGKSVETETHLPAETSKSVRASEYGSRRLRTVEAPVIRFIVDRVDEVLLLSPEEMMLNHRIVIGMDKGVITLWRVRRRLWSLSDLFSVWLRGLRCLGIEYNEIQPEIIGRNRSPPVGNVKVSSSPLSSLSALPASFSSPASTSDELFYSASSSPWSSSPLALSTGSSNFKPC